MLRVGLTGELGSGKTTVAKLLATRGAVVLSSDEMARGKMEPGEPVYRAIVEAFGPSVLDVVGRLNRAELARLAFDPTNPRVEELNAIVHPAVLAAQEEQMRRVETEQPGAVVVVESALVFSVKLAAPVAVEGHQSGGIGSTAEPWRSRFHCIVVVTASRATKIARFVARASAVREELSAAEREQLESDAVRRLDTQAEAAVPQDDAILFLPNDGDLERLATRVNALWLELQQRAQAAYPHR